MTTILYPTAAGVELVLRWCDDGPLALDPSGAQGSNPRQENLIRLRETIQRLSMPHEYEGMRKAVFRRDIRRINDRLRAQLLIRLRAHGYIYRTGPVPDGRTYPPHAPVPLSGRQLHIVRLLADGMSGAQIAAELMVGSEARVWERMSDARKTLGLGTNRELIATVYRREWFPSDREAESLARLCDGPLGRGWILAESGTRGRVLCDASS